MIPHFPDFKVVEVTDRNAVEVFTHKYPPYSDFNFTSLWAWDTSNERMISELNGNLVVRFTDYSTHEPFLSFLGTNETEHTARTLLEYSKSNGLPTILKLMPEVSVQNIRPSVLRAEEDRDNFDYICSIPDHALLRGTAYRPIRHRVNNFIRDNHEAHLEIIDLNNVGAQDKILKTMRSWEENKVEQKKNYELQHEHNAIKRLFQTAYSHKLVVNGIFLEDQMLAFMILEILPNQNSMYHFWKANTKYKGCYDFLLQESAKHLETLSVSLGNWEQDLGVSGLRVAKTTLRPVSFLKKYLLSSV